MSHGSLNVARSLRETCIILQAIDSPEMDFSPFESLVFAEFVEHEEPGTVFLSKEDKIPLGVHVEVMHVDSTAGVSLT